MDRQMDTVLSLACSERLDAVALRKLVLFVNGLMEQYFDFVRQRVQLEVCALWCVSLLWVREVSSQVCREIFFPPAHLLFLRFPVIEVHFFFFFKYCENPCNQDKTPQWDVWSMKLSWRLWGLYLEIMIFIPLRKNLFFFLLSVYQIL